MVELLYTVLGTFNLYRHVCIYTKTLYLKVVEAKLYVTYSEGLAVCCGEQRIFVVSHPAECVSEECDGQNYGLEKLGSIGLFELK